MTTTLRDAETCYSKAAKAELDRDYDRAFQLYVKATENFLHVSQITSDTSVRNVCKTQAGKALERAEKIKVIKRDLTPVVKNHFSEQEQSHVLKKSSIVNNTLIPLWDENSSSSPSTVSIQPTLSPEQKHHGAVWRRLTSLQWCIYSRSSLSAQDVMQHIVSDCSVCASAAVFVNHNRQFGSKLGISSLYPHDSNGFPVSSDNGRYSMRVLFNGAYRRIELDDQVPCYSDGTPMCVTTGSKKQLLPALIEKAYMKLMGGYDFPGSNSSADMHTLTGWIPEYIEIRSPRFEREKTWRRILDGYTKGQCVLTLGSGEIPIASDESPIALLPAHCYAVVDVRGRDDDRQMTILDTWICTEGVDELSMSKLSLEDRENSQAQSFDLSWGTICNLFDGIYLSWDPGIFNDQSNFHGIWKSEDATDNAQPRHFQLSLKAEGPASISNEQDVWVLLTRHVVDTNRNSQFIALSAQDKENSDTNTVALKGAYTTSTHVLVKVQCSQPSTEFLIAASYDGEYDDVGFTVTVYSSLSIAWMQDIMKLPFTEKVTSSFTSKTAGGNPTYPTFMVNPQYRLHIYPDKPETAAAVGGRGKKAHLELDVQGDRHIPLNITLVWSKGERVTEVAHSDIVATSGPYSYSFANATKDLQAGEYTVIVSAFEPRHMGLFSLMVKSSRRFHLSPIPQEGAGMYSKVMRGAWLAGTAAGGPSFKRYTSNPVYELKVPSQSHVKVRLQLEGGRKSAALNVTLFRMTNNCTLGAHVVTSGPYSDTVSGVVTPQTLLQPGSYLIIPSTYTPGIEAQYRLIIYSTAAGINAAPVQLASSS